MISPDGPTIDELSEVARASDGDLDAQTSLWRAMFALEKWWFVARGTAPALAPLVSAVGGVSSLLAFTTAARARDFALASGFSEEEANQVLAVPASSVLDTCDHLTAQGVQRLVVDQGTLGFFAPLTQLRPIHDFITQSPRSDATEDHL